MPDHRGFEEPGEPRALAAEIPLIPQAMTGEDFEGGTAIGLAWEKESPTQLAIARQQRNPGDMEAIGELLDIHNEWLLRMSRRRLGYYAKVRKFLTSHDVSQDLAIRLLTCLKSRPLNSVEHFKALCHQNLEWALDSLAERYKYCDPRFFQRGDCDGTGEDSTSRPLHELIAAPSSAIPLNAILAMERASRLVEELGKLKPVEREVYQHYYLDGFSSRKIARLHPRLNERTVPRILNRVRSRLFEALRDPEIATREPLGRRDRGRKRAREWSEGLEEGSLE